MNTGFFGLIFFGSGGVTPRAVRSVARFSQRSMFPRTNNIFRMVCAPVLPTTKMIQYGGGSAMHFPPPFHRFSLYLFSAYFKIFGNALISAFLALFFGAPSALPLFPAIHKPALLSGFDQIGPPDLYPPPNLSKRLAPKSLSPMFCLLFIPRGFDFLIPL